MIIKCTQEGLDILSEAFPGESFDGLWRGVPVALVEDALCAIVIENSDAAWVVIGEKWFRDRGENSPYKETSAADVARLVMANAGAPEKT